MVPLSWINNSKASICAKATWVNHSDSFHTLIILVAHLLARIVESSFVAVYWDLVVIILALVCYHQEIRVRVQV